MRRVLIGLGTSLGSYLASGRSFSECYTYKQALNGFSRCKEVVLVAPGEKRLSGTSLGPRGRALIAAISQTAGRVILLSSIDVYPSKGLPFDEGSAANGSSRRALLPVFERGVMECGTPSTILRLPEVFGPNFAKGLPGRLLDRDASRINRVAIHQWYPVRRLEKDISLARDFEAPIINLCPQPLPMTAVLAELFPGQMGHVLTPAPYSRIRTRYSEKFGGRGGYIVSAEEVLEEMSAHVRAVRRRSLLARFADTSFVQPAAKIRA